MKRANVIRPCLRMRSRISSSTAELIAFATLGLDLDVRVPDELRESRHVRSQQGAELFGVRNERLERLIRQPRGSVGGSENARHLAGDLVDDRLRRAGGREHAA